MAVARFLLDPVCGTLLHDLALTRGLDLLDPCSVGPKLTLLRLLELECHPVAFPNRQIFVAIDIPEP